jgi:hypothetical protein
LGNAFSVTGVNAPTTIIEKNTTMKKTILLAAMFGLTVALTAKGAEAKENWDTLCAVNGG